MNSLKRGIGKNPPCNRKKSYSVNCVSANYVGSSSDLPEVLYVGCFEPNSYLIYVNFFLR